MVSAQERRMLKFVVWEDALTLENDKIGRR